MYLYLPGLTFWKAFRAQSQVHSLDSYFRLFAKAGSSHLAGLPGTPRGWRILSRMTCCTNTWVGVTLSFPPTQPHAQGVHRSPQLFLACKPFLCPSRKPAPWMPGPRSAASQEGHGRPLTSQCMEVSSPEPRGLPGAPSGINTNIHTQFIFLKRGGPQLASASAKGPGPTEGGSPCSGPRPLPVPAHYC